VCSLYGTDFFIEMKEGCEKLIEQISHQVEIRKEELINLLTDLVAFPTVSPPARNTNRLQRVPVSITYTTNPARKGYSLEWLSFSCGASCDFAICNVDKKRQMQTVNNGNRTGERSFFIDLWP
jgi:hypothetical protein